MVKNKTGDNWCTQKLRIVFIVFHADIFSTANLVVLNGCCDWEHLGNVLGKHEKRSYRNKVKIFGIVAIIIRRENH
jgi:hypothetical protein